MELIGLLVMHFMADWVLQPKTMSKEKSESFKVLLQHVAIHIVVFFFGCMLLFTLKQAILFTFFNAITHGTIDWFVWRFYKTTVWMRREEYVPRNITEEGKKRYLQEHFKYWEDQVFGIFLGFDQLLHVTVLVILYQTL